MTSKSSFGVKSSFRIVFFLVFASLVAVATSNQAHAQTVQTVPAKPAEEDKVLVDGAVTVYVLPDAYKQVLLGRDKNGSDDIYAIEYSMYSNPSGESKPPGISSGGWYDENKRLTGKFFPWRLDLDLAQDLSKNSNDYFEENTDILLPNGDMPLYSYSNGGGFVYNKWSTTPPDGFDNRPLNDGDGSQNQGLEYFYNGKGYYTRAGNDGAGRIQAFGGCVVNTIQGNVRSSELIGGSNGENYCSFDGNNVSSNVYAPVFEGGTLDVVGEGQVFAQKFYLANQGGTFDNQGSNVEISGSFSDYIPNPTSGTLTFEGGKEVETLLTGENNYTGETIITSGVLRVKGSLAQTSSILIKKGAKLRVEDDGSINDTVAVNVLEGGVYFANSDDTIGLISGEGRLNLYKNTKILTVGALNQDSIFSGRIHGQGDLAKTGTGILTLSGSNGGYDGHTYIRQGTLRITDSSGLGLTENAKKVDNGTTVQQDAQLVLALNGTSNTDRATVNEPILLEGGILGFDGQHLILAGDDASLELKGNSRISVTTDSKDAYISVKDGIFGPGDLIKIGGGTLIINAPLPGSSKQRYQRDTLVRDGLLIIDSSTSLPATTNVEIDPSATLRILNSSQELRSLMVANAGQLDSGDLSLESLSNRGQMLVGSLAGTSAPNRFENYGSIRIDGKIQMGQGDDLFENYGDLSASQGVEMGAGDDLFRFAAGELSLDAAYLVNGGQGNDSLILNNPEMSDAYASDFDATQELPSGRQLIVASDLADRFVSFENLIQEKGVFAYRGDFSKNFEFVTLRDGSFIASESSPAIFDTLRLEKDATIYVGMINTTGDEFDRAPIVVAGDDPDRGFIYEGGEFIISADRQDNPVGSFFVIEGNVVGAEALAENSRIVYDCDLENVECTQQEFSGLGPTNGISAALHDAFLEEGSLKLVVNLKTDEEEFCDLFPGDPKCNSDDPGPVDPDPIDPDPIDPDPIDPVDPDPIDPVIPDPSDPLPGCDSSDPLCDLISDIDSWKDRATDEEEAVARQVIDALLDGLHNHQIVLPMINYGSLAKLVGSGLLPRNVDAPGRSLFNYNNLLVDTVFERLPLRQFKAVEVAEVVEEEAVIVEPQAEEEPIRGLWSQSEGMDEQQVQEYLEQRVAQGEQVVVEEAVIELDGVGYVENPSLTAQYAERDGVRAWYRAFGGDIGPTQTSILYGDYSASAGGMVLGADVSLGSNVQIGAFANYGDVSLNQFGGDTGSGSWNPNGWGGGITADWWSENFYVQGLISATSFSGNQKRNIVRINDNLGDETASGDRSATSYSYALRLGAPFQAGSLLMEPQFTAAWTQNQESGFSENGADQLNLRYGSRTTNFLQTELGMKFALPIRSGERAEWVPNLRVAWLGDWDQNNGDQSIGYRFTDQDVDVPSYEKDNNGVLIEGGIDYTMAKINSGSWKLYVRGGAEVWGGERGTDWRASGGVTFQF